MSSTSADVVILGGGPAGLGAALWAARGGRSVVLVERAPVVGGMAASFEVGGVRVDHGSHRLHPTTPAPVLAELDRLLGGELQVRRRNGRIALEGRWVAFPLRPAALVRELPPSFVAAALRDALTAPLRRVRADTFAEVVRAGLGPTMGERFYFPYARKIWGAPPGELSGEQARRRITASSHTELARRVLRRGGDEGRTFRYPSRGFGRIPEVLADAAVSEGAEVRTGVAATSLDGTAVSLDDGTTVDARQVWSTIPLPALARLASAPAPVLEAAARLEHRSLVLLYLVLDARQWTPFDAHYLPGPSTPVTRVSEPRNYRDGPDPADRTVLCCEIPCATGDAVWSADPGELADRVAADLGALGLPPVRPVHAEVRRLPAAYPIYRVGYETDLAPVDAWIGGLPGVRSFGRLGLFAHDNTHHALAEAREAARSIDDDAAWDRARSAFAAHVVED